jgi:flagellin
MSMVINTNTASLVAQAAQAKTSSAMDTAMERLSTGKRINTAADDAAGIAISTRLTAEITGINQAMRNAADGQAMIDTAEGAHDEIGNILQRMRELAVQSANDTNNSTDRNYLQAEVNALVTEIDRIANVTSWAGKGLIDSQHTYSFQVGARGASDNQINVTMNAMTGAALGVKAGTAAVGANGATLASVGAQVLQIGGTPVEGDVYKFSLNGDAVEVEISGTSGNDFTFDYKINGVAVPTGGAGNTVDEADVTGLGGTDKHAVAKAIAGIVNAMADTSDGGTQGGMTAVAASDGSVTFTQGLSVSGANFDESTAGDGSLDIAGALDLANNKIVFTDLENATFASGDDFALTLNGVSLAFTNMATDYAASSDGFLAAVNKTLADNADKLKGLTNLTAAYNVGNDLEISWTPATALTSVSATPGQSTSALLITTASDANAAIATIDTALNTVNAQRAELGAVSNRLESTISNLSNISVNLEAGRSRIQDADFATETSNLTKTQILSQAATAMLAQANASKQSVLSLLQG